MTLLMAWGCLFLAAAGGLAVEGTPDDSPAQTVAGIICIGGVIGLILLLMFH